MIAIRSIQAASGDKSRRYGLGRSAGTRWRLASKSKLQNWKLEAFVAIPVILGILLAVSTTSAATHCEPLLVTIEGGASSGGSSIRKLYRHLDDVYSKQEIRVMNIDNSYFFTRFSIRNWNPIPVAREGEMESFAEILKMFGFWPIVLVGHSLGGSTAHDIASRVPISLLVTLDAVSSPDNLPHPNLGARWINVYAKNRWLVWGWGNGIGEDWEYEGAADRNEKMTNTGHYRIFEMFSTVSEDVSDALHDCTSKPPQIDPPSTLAYRMFCAGAKDLRCSNVK